MDVDAVAVPPQRREAQLDGFEAFYLRNVTVELADDLDKVRAAGDFSDEKLGILVKALKQGADLFSAEEKRAFLERQREREGKANG